MKDFRQAMITPLLLTCAFLAVPFIGIGVFYIYNLVVPVNSAEVKIDTNNTTLRVDVFLTTSRERHLTVYSGGESLKRQMRSDWGPAMRTSIYMTPQNDIVLLGPAHDDYYLTTSPLALHRQFPSNSERWTYIGAFDYVDERKRGGKSHNFRFITPAEQSECIPTLMDGDEGGPHRKQAYQRSC